MQDRRSFMSSFATLLAVAPVLQSSGTGLVRKRGKYVLVNGWVLKHEDVKALDDYLATHHP
jgi:hypothetical protein